LTGIRPILDSLFYCKNKDLKYYDKANSKSKKLKEQAITHGGYSSKIAYEYNTGDQNTKGIDGASTYRFDYDDHGNVRTYTAGNGSGSTFNYDQTGKVSDLVVGTKPYGEKSGATILLERYKYDKTGNRTEIARDLESNKKEIVKYEYDDDGRRIEKEVNGQITRYFYDGDSINPLYETNGDGKVLRQYVYSIDGVRLAMKAQGQTLFYHYNPRGDVVAMTEGNGQVVANYEYDAWGNVLKSEATGIAADNPFGYATVFQDFRNIMIT
ncbi:type IV secretion protein Rhs, partial [Bacillus toyonensis]|uniref:RHS repeat domain-containing protein n=1 Tax=Bacillus toyonensis TaxID=155322 RepID=UPI003AA7EC81